MWRPFKSGLMQTSKSTTLLLPSSHQSGKHTAQLAESGSTKVHFLFPFVPNDAKCVLNVSLIVSWVIFGKLYEQSSQRQLRDR